MKKLRREHKELDYVRLFVDYSAQRKIAEYSEHAIREFSNEMAQELCATVNADHRKRGVRAELLFQAVVAGIGKVALIKAEDNGEAFFTGDELLIPDFRVVLLDGSQMLVEVKAQRMDNSFDTPLKLSDSVVQKYRRYASLTQASLMIATFWEELSLWTLNRLDAFSPGIAGEKQWSISFRRAMATNEMESLGDCSIATMAPLRIRIIIDPDRSEHLPSSDDVIQVTIAGIELFSQNTVLRDLSAKIAWRLIWHSGWDEIGKSMQTDEDRLLWVEYVIGPPEWSEQQHDPQEPVIVGAMSEMISRAYLQGAERTIHTNAGGDILMPGYMGNFIPPDFPSLNLELPLYVFRLKPNFSFDESG